MFIILISMLSQLAIAQADCPLRSKLGQMFLVGIGNDILNADHELDKTSETAQHLKELNVGGVFIAGPNVGGMRNFKIQCANKKQIQNFVSRLQENRKPKMFVAVDQEGGRIQGLKPCSGFKELPSLAEIGEHNDIKSAFQSAYDAARELYDIGINWNFSPVLDVNGEQENPVIGGLDRAISTDPNVVSRVGEALFEGTQAAGIIASAKHFPGHGEATGDSHRGSVEINKSWDEITRKDLVPFINAFNKGINSVMVGHINLREDCGFGKDPASLNELLIQNVIRGQMKYNGLVVTDDLSMGAITNNYSNDDAIKKAIIAGNDVIVLHDVEQAEGAIKNICHELNSNTKDSKRLQLRIEEATERILRLKSTQGL